MEPGRRLALVPVVAVDAMLAELHLIELANRSIEEISIGQRQHLAIARAVLCRPQLILVDEATSFQDSESSTVVVDVLRSAAAASSAVVVASHDPVVVDRADNVITLSAPR